MDRYYDTPMAMYSTTTTTTVCDFEQEELRYFDLFMLVDFSDYMFRFTVTVRTNFDGVNVVPISRFLKKHDFDVQF